MTEVTSSHKWLRLPDDVLATYNSWDVVATAKVWKRLSSEMERISQTKYWAREFWPLVPAVLAMQRLGIPIDAAERTRLRKEFRSEVRTTDRQLCAAAGYPYTDPWDKKERGKGFNPNSDTQVRRWLFGVDKGKPKPRGEKVAVKKGIEVECLGLRPAGKTTENQWSVDQTNLLRVLRDLRKMDEHAVPVLHDLLHRSRYVKLDEYLDFEIVDGRIYPRIKMYGTKTMRFAYADPPVHSWADELRSMVRAQPGYLILAADFKALEARLHAILAKDQEELAAFARGDDIHAYTAREILKITPEQWVALPDKVREQERVRAKTIRFGTLLYGGEPETAKLKTFCPCPRCKGKVPETPDLNRTQLRQAVDDYFARHPNVQRRRQELLRNFKGPHATHSLRARSGCLRFFHKPYGPDLQREVFNWEIQHLDSFVMGRAQRRLHDAYRAPIILQWHDAFYLEVPERDVVQWTAWVREAMEQRHPELDDYSFPVDLKVGERISNLKKVGGIGAQAAEASRGGSL